ncbi:MAG: DUF2065 family protein [Candidatus Omnitrophica bacterium]|nr:DUF2065 family protein [Candidatus Omnitrophota bacterium]
MITLARLLGIFIACMGVIVVLIPVVMRKMVAFWRKNNRIYLGGLIRMIFGAIFLLSAPRARLSTVMTLAGLFSLIAGLLIFILKPEKIKMMLERWDKRPDSVLRLMGAVVFAFGALIIYSI